MASWSSCIFLRCLRSDRNAWPLGLSSRVFFLFAGVCGSKLLARTRSGAVHAVQEEGRIQSVRQSSNVVAAEARPPRYRCPAAVELDLMDSGVFVQFYRFSLTVMCRRSVCAVDRFVSICCFRLRFLLYLYAGTAGIHVMTAG